jgi:uncharacterized glyoxalase superfamily protein PhnB
VENYTSKIGNHVYVKGGAQAVELYKEAFRLEEQGKPWLDDEGLIIHHQLLRNGEPFLSISENKHLPDGFIKHYSADVCPAMLFCVYFRNEDDFRRTFELLSKEGNSCTGAKVEGEDTICDLIDKFGIFWHLRFPKNQNAPFIPK